MPFSNLSSYPYSQSSIQSNAPRQSGVYGLFSPGKWIYVGESGDIQERVMQHLNGDNPCITRQSPVSFTFELVSAANRVGRQNALIQEFAPVCNKAG